jgi:hypothetical protein
VTQPARKRNTKTILIVVASVVAACCLLGGGVGFFAYRAVQSTLGPPREATEAFLVDLKAGDAASAYEKLCEATRSRTTQAELADKINSHKPTAHQITGVEINTVNGETSAAVTARLTYPGGISEPHTFRLRKEDNMWKVCGNPY